MQAPAPKGRPSPALTRMLLDLSADRLDSPELDLLAEVVGKDFDRRRPIVPLALLSRDLAVAGSGGYLKGQDALRPASMLRTYSIAARAGVTVVDALKGDTVLPVIT